MLKSLLLTISFLLNLIFILGLVFYKLNSPTYQLGILEKDVEVGVFGNDSTIFTIPKGITVRDASERGLAAIGQFENERFEIIITSNDYEIVNYNVPKEHLKTFGNYYSCRVKNE